MTATAEADAAGDGGPGGWRRRAQALKRQVRVVQLVARDPRTPRAAKVVALATVAYALSPIDLIPDPIPVLGLLDDLVLVPAGVALTLRLVPDAVVEDARARAREGPLERTAASYAVAVLVVLLWLALLWWAWGLVAGHLLR